MFGIDSGEILIIAVVALVVIGPKDLPRVMRAIGNFVGRARGMARHFRTGIDAMMREAELEEMEKKWKAENARIMREYPAGTDSDWGKAAADRPDPSDETEAARPPKLAPPAAPEGAPPAPPPRSGRKGKRAGSAPPIPPAGAAPGDG